jgi:hypothetical protein
MPAGRGSFPDVHSSTGLWTPKATCKGHPSVLVGGNVVSRVLETPLPVSRFPGWQSAMVVGIAAEGLQM